MNVKPLFKLMVEKKASDLFFAPFAPAKIKIDGKIMPVNKLEMTPKMVKQAAIELMTEEQLDTFMRELEIDFAISEPGLGRFRVNVFHQRGNVSMVLRYITAELPTLDELGMPEQMKELVMLRRGLILMVGATGSGKSTTLASMINLINRDRKEHILTIEDPIEYVYPKLNCVVTQREIGTHSNSFKDSLKRSMRQDPDILLIGEMRDLETIAAALTLAETGHLVFATLHTTDAAQTIDRIIDVFPPYQQEQVRTQLSVSLRAVICQQLLPLADGRGRVAAREVMILNSAISNLIREGKTHQIYNAIEMGTKFGMKSLDKDLADLVHKGIVTFDAALAKANNINLFKSIAQGARP